MVLHPSVLHREGIPAPTTKANAVEHRRTQSCALKSSQTPSIKAGIPGTAFWYLETVFWYLGIPGTVYGIPGVVYGIPGTPWFFKNSRSTVNSPRGWW
jgi:hypothetical protein